MSFLIKSGSASKSALLPSGRMTVSMSERLAYNIKMMMVRNLLNQTSNLNNFSKINLCPIFFRNKVKREITFHGQTNCQHLKNIKRIEGHETQFHKLNPSHFPKRFSKQTSRLLELTAINFSLIPPTGRT